MHSQLCKEKTKQKNKTKQKHSPLKWTTIYQQLFHVLPSKESTSKLNSCIDIGIML